MQFLWCHSVFCRVGKFLRMVGQVQEVPKCCRLVYCLLSVNVLIDDRVVMGFCHVVVGIVVVLDVSAVSNAMIDGDQCGWGFFYHDVCVFYVCGDASRFLAGCIDCWTRTDGMVGLD